MELFKVVLAQESEEGKASVVFNEDFLEFATEEELINTFTELEIIQMHEIVNNVYVRVREMALR